MHLEPGSEGSDDRGRRFRAGGQADLRRAAPHRRLDGVELGDLAQGLFGDRRGIDLQALDEAPTDMCPAVDELSWPFRTSLGRQGTIGLVLVALQEPATIAIEKTEGMHAAAAGGVVEHHDRWSNPAVPVRHRSRTPATRWLTVGDDGPEPAGLRRPAARVQHRRSGRSELTVSKLEKRQPRLSKTHSRKVDLIVTAKLRLSQTTRPRKPQAAP